MADVQTQAGSIEAHAIARHVRMSPQKARLVIDLIRGHKAQDALQSLRFTPKRAAKHIEKVLRSAIANAEQKAEDSGSPLDVDQLYVSKCFVNEGARWKRLRPAPDGPCVPVSEAHRAYLGGRCGASSSPLPNALPPIWPKRKHRRVFAEPLVAFARL